MDVFSNHKFFLMYIYSFNQCDVMRSCTKEGTLRGSEKSYSLIQLLVEPRLEPII